ncbi:MAG: hypothetical protein V4564_15920 [Pseudomonadota bacterium]
MLALAGCQAQQEQTGYAASQPNRGRYVGIGLYNAGPLWPKLKLADPPKDKPVDVAAPTLADDSTIIVVVDSETGEIRQCGDMSGYCARSNPWSKTALGAPVSLTKHAADLVREEKATADTEADPFPKAR